MFNNKYIPLDVVIDRVKRGRLYKELPYETAVDYAVDVIKLLNSEKAEVTKPAKIKIKSHKGKLPEDLERVLQVVKTDKELKCLTPMRYATDNLHSQYHCINSPDLRCNSPLTYSINNNLIKTSFEEGYIFLVYKGLKTDENGVIMVPDNINVILAIEHYIKSRFLDDMGVENDNNILHHQNKNEQQYCWYIGKAQAAMTELSQDEYESFANSMSKLFINTNDYNSFLINLGTKQYIRNQRYG